MNPPLNTSVFLTVAVALWLIWVVPSLLRLRKRQVPALAAAMEEPKTAANDSEPMTMMMNAPGPQEAAMNGTNDSVAKDQAQAPVPFKVKYDRLAIALVGALAAVTLLVGLVLRIAGVGSIWVPALAFLIAVGSVVGLRTLAIRDRKSTLESAFRAAMGSVPETQETISVSKAVPAELKPTTLFDAQQSAAPETPVPLTAAELRRAALAVAEGAQIKDDGTWEPVAVPKPSYVEAAKAERPAPAPLDLPEQPKPAAKTSIKQSEAGIGKAAVAQQADKNAAALNNLDDVLQRRRA